MIGSDEIITAFQVIAPDVVGSDDPTQALANANVDPDAVTPVAQALVGMFIRAETSPEDATFAAFIIGLLLGLRLNDAPASSS